MSMGTRIRQARNRKGYTQEYVAEALDVSRQAVHKWEKDQTKPDTANLVALAQLLDTTVDQLLGSRIEKKNSTSDKYFKASLLPLILMPICWLMGLFSGVYTDMVQIPVGNGVRMGIPFLMYGHSPLAVILVTVSIICFLVFLLLLYLGHQANKGAGS